MPRLTMLGLRKLMTDGSFSEYLFSSENQSGKSYGLCFNLVFTKSFILFNPDTIIFKNDFDDFVISDIQKIEVNKSVLGHILSLTCSNGKIIFIMR